MDKFNELEKRIKALENNQIQVIMSYNADTNVLRSLQRSLANNSLAIGTSNTVKSAILELSSINKGLVVTRMTTAQRDAIVGPAAGMIIYNTSTNVLNFYNGSAWGAV